MKLWKRGVALVLAVSACFTLLAACGQGEAVGDQLALSVCVGETPATYDPIYAEEAGEQTILNHLYENLMRLEQDENGQAVAVNGAARSVDMKENADGTVTYTFRLRGGKWSDGVDVKASDFVYAWQRLADPATGSAYAPLLSIVSGYDAARASGDMSQLAVTAKNNTTLVVTLDGQYDWFLREVCTSIATMPLRQDVVQRLKQKADEANAALADEASVNRWWSDPTQLVTNGPYVASAGEETSLTLTENTAYGKKLTGPTELTFRFGDNAAAQVLYDQGVVDVIWPLTEEQMSEKKAENEDWQADPVLETYSVLFNCGKLEDEQIRKALSLAIDRTALADLVSVSAQAATGLVPPGVPEGEADFRTTGGDLLDNDGAAYEIRCQEAVELMQEAGYDRGSDLGAELGTLEYLYVDEGNNAAVAAALCGMWNQCLGLNVTPRAVEKTELMTALRSGSYTLAGLGLDAVCNDAECFLMDWTTGNADNYLHYENSAYDTLMSIIASAKDGTARMGCLHDAEDLILEIDCALAPLYTTGTAWRLRDTYLGGFRDPRGWFDFRSVYLKPVTVQ